MKGDYITDNLIMKLKNTISKYYTDKGFLNAEINVTEKKDSAASNEESLLIDIKRNSRIKIYQIAIHGNEHMTAEQIKATFKKTKEKSIFNPLDDLDKMIYACISAVFHMDFLEIANVIDKTAYHNIRLRIFKTSKFIADDYEDDKVNLIEKYNSLGYRDAKILRDSISRNDENTINIDIWVDEGPILFPEHQLGGEYEIYR